MTLSSKLTTDQKTMKAILYDQYGSPDVLQVKEIDRPGVGDDEVLIRVCAAGANPYDWRFMRGEPYFMRLFTGLLCPKTNRLGADMAGQVEAVGKNVTQFQPGDEVYGRVQGTFAEYVCVSEQAALVLRPTNLTFEQAAAVPMAAYTALQGLRDQGQLRPGQKVLINGASGGIGTFAVQIAKALGAEVTAVCSTQKVKQARSIGADQVIDYRQEDFIQVCSQGQYRYDLMLDIVGNRELSECQRVLKPNGTYVIVGAPDKDRWLGPLAHFLKVSLAAPFVSQKVVTLDTKAKKEDLLFLKELIEADKITPIVERQYPLTQVPEALRYLEEGHAQGKIVITV